MDTFNIHEAKTHLSRLIERAAKGESFIIAKAGKAMVKVVPIDAPEQRQKRRIGFMKGEGLLRITPEGEQCTVQYDGDVHVGGTFAAVGQRLIDSTSKLMIKRFFDKLCERAAAASAP